MKTLTFLMLILFGSVSIGYVGNNLHADVHPNNTSESSTRHLIFTEGKKTTKEEMDRLVGELRTKQDVDHTDGNRREVRRVIRIN